LTPRRDGAIRHDPARGLTGFVDIHSHLLPGIDDGPETLDGSLAMARAAAAAGTAVLTATPHLHASFPNVHIEEVGERVQRMQAAIDEAGIELQVVPAAETSLLWAIEASDEQLRLATYGQLGADLLVETPNDVSMIEQLLYQVRARGVRVTLAHPSAATPSGGTLSAWPACTSRGSSCRSTRVGCCGAVPRGRG
jgi:tyrosine-protein phosphatase YwqE